MTARIQSALAAAMIFVSAGTGCGTSYSPREPGRISFVLSGKGEEILERDGKRYDISGFSNGLVEAVSGNAPAEEHAREYVRRQRTSHALAIATGVTFLVSCFLLAVSTGEPTRESRSEPRQDHRAGFAIAAAVSAVLGGTLLTAAAVNGGAAQGHLYDAINIFNDGAAARSVR